MSYTLLAVIGAVAASGLDLAVFRTNLLRRKAFWTAYAIMLGFQLVINGLLTGLPVVRYDVNQIVGWRVIHAPVEDVLFGFALITVTLSTWAWLGVRARRRASR